MITILLLILIIAFIAAVPRTYFYGSAVISVILISVMIALWQPNEEADLYRHYQFLSDLSFMSFKDAISMKYR